MAQEEPLTAQDDIHESLTDLENDPEADEFDRMLIRNARDERRLNDALHGQVQPFRKARTHPRVGVTLENLERHNTVGSGTAAGANAQFKRESPPSSNGSARSDPAIRPPSSWGRKGRTRRDWMRTIKVDEPQGPGTPQHTESPEVPASDLPRPSIEDSPLSHKSSLQGTPAASRQNRFDDDWSFDLNNASVIASTPYIPRSTALDDIRQREIESEEDFTATTSPREEIQESAYRQEQRPSSMFARSTSHQSNGIKAAEQTRETGPTERSRKQANSWQTIGKSQPVTSQDTENSPIVVHKISSESISAYSRPGLIRPSQRKDDSHDLLRRLSRLSSTPSPGRVTGRPQTARTEKPDNASVTMNAQNTEQPGDEKAVARVESSTVNSRSENDAGNSYPAQRQAGSSKMPRSRIAPHEQTKGESSTRSWSNPTPQDHPAKDIAATPIPAERSVLNPKTPVVTGAWIDTPRAATVLKPPPEAPSDPAKPTKNGSPSKRSPQKQTAAPPEEEPPTAPPEAVKPNLPRSALQAVLEQGKNEYGESTINSLEELISPHAGASEDETTLPDIQTPTGAAPRNPAERVRQDEHKLLHSMNDRLRAVSTGIRQVGRGIGKLERQVEQGEEAEGGGEQVRTRTATTKTCSCDHHHDHERVARWTLWKGLKGLFYDKNLKKTSSWGWGLTGLSIFLLTFFTWFVVENVACEAFCHHTHASIMVDYGVTYGAPKFPFVIPTMFYRVFIRFWWEPLWKFFLSPLWSQVSAVYDVRSTATATVLKASRARATQATRVWMEEGVRGMGADEVVG